MITITIVESTDKIVAGIPRYVTISTDIPSTVFYTLDGSIPDLYSDIYISDLYLPEGQTTVTLKLFATNGVNSSDIIVNEYSSDFGEIKLPRQEVIQNVNSCDTGPFTSNKSDSFSLFLGNTDAGVVVDKYGVENVNKRYDGEGNLIGGTDVAPTYSQVIYTTTNKIGETGRGIGNFPATVTIQKFPPPKESSNKNEALFDPRALVIYQNADDQQGPQHINRLFFNLDNTGADRDGNAFFTSGMESQVGTGSFVSKHYNPVTKRMNVYYRDSITNRWIINSYDASKIVFGATELYNIAKPRNHGIGMVFQWIPFKGSRLI